MCERVAMLVSKIHIDEKRKMQSSISLSSRNRFLYKIYIHVGNICRFYIPFLVYVQLYIVTGYMYPKD